MEAEVDFLWSLVSPASAAGETTPPSLLELACGPALHAHKWVERVGGRSVGIDSEERAVAHARGKGRAEIRQGDMEGVQQAVGGLTFKLVALLENGLAHATTVSEAAEVFRQAAGALDPPGGTFVVQLEPLRELFDGTLCGPVEEDDGSEGGEEGEGGSAHEWGVECEDGSMVVCEMEDEEGSFDCELQVKRQRVRLARMRQRSELSVEEEAVAVNTLRRFTNGELEALARSCGMQMVASLGGLDWHSPPVGSPEAHSHVAVFRLSNTPQGRP